MRKAFIVAVVAIGSSLALYGAIHRSPAEMQNALNECCDKTECCPMEEPEECCEFSCE